MSFDPLDAFTGQLSDCCGAPVMQGDMCSDCKEHCTPEDEEEDPTPYCAICRAKKEADCKCGPIADNE